MMMLLPVRMQTVVVLPSSMDIDGGYQSVTKETNGAYPMPEFHLRCLSPNSIPLENKGGLVTEWSMFLRPPLSVTATHALDLESMRPMDTLSSIPIIWQYELHSQYQELGKALLELRELDEGEEWRIDEPVYEAALRVAFDLVDLSLPTPAIFTHGPKSVVFNWESGNTNLYLTVSADHISALVSTPASIQRRLEISKAFLGEQKLSSAVQLLYSGQRVFPIPDGGPTVSQGSLRL